MLPNPGPGRFIAVEGLDGSGKTTQVRLLGQRLGASRPVHITCEPTDGPIGLQIRLVLGKRVRVSAATLAALFAADRADHLYHPQTGILARLKRGIDVISDRYYLSSFAYQGMSLDWDWIWHMHACCIRPEATVFVDVPVEVCLARIARGRSGHADLFENREALTRARHSHIEAIDRLRAAGDRLVVVDGDAPPDRVHEAIWQAMCAVLEGQEGPEPG
jgi:dTMP kinase